MILACLLPVEVNFIFNIMPVTIYNGFQSTAGSFAVGNPLPIVLNGLVLFFDPNSERSYPGSGTVINDLSGYLHSGSLINAPVYSTSSAGGKIFTFNGTDEYIDLNAYPRLDSGQATYQFWVRDGDPSDVSLNRQIIARTNTNVGTFNILKRVTTGAIGVNFRSTATPATQINYSSSIILNTCYSFITVTYDGSFIKLWTNVSLDPVSQSAAGTIDTAGNATINIARNTTGAAYWTGSIGPIAIYDRALNEDEINQNYYVLSGLYPEFSLGTCF